MAILRQNRSLWLLFYVIAGLALVAGIYLAALSAQGAPTPVVDEDADEGAEQVVLDGTYVCLPRADQKKAAECTPGIQVGSEYYALDLAELLGSGAPTNFTPGSKILAGGAIIPLEDVVGDQWDIYAIKGVMQVLEVARQ